METRRVSESMCKTAIFTSFLEHELMVTPISDSEMSAGRQASRSSPAPSGPTKVSSSQSRLMPPSAAWAAASPRQRRSRDSDGFQLEADDELEDHQVRIFVSKFFSCEQRGKGIEP